jgi:hypothetical protein
MSDFERKEGDDSDDDDDENYSDASNNFSYDSSMAVEEGNSHYWHETNHSFIFITDKTVTATPSNRLDATGHLSDFEQETPRCGYIANAKTETPRCGKSSEAPRYKCEGSDSGKLRYKFGDGALSSQTYCSDSSFPEITPVPSQTSVEVKSSAPQQTSAPLSSVVLKSEPTEKSSVKEEVNNDSDDGTSDSDKSQEVQTEKITSNIEETAEVVLSVGSKSAEAWVIPAISASSQQPQEFSEETSRRNELTETVTKQTKLTMDETDFEEQGSVVTETPRALSTDTTRTISTTATKLGSTSNAAWVISASVTELGQEKQQSTVAETPRAVYSDATRTISADATETESNAKTSSASRSAWVIPIDSGTVTKEKPKPQSSVVAHKTDDSVCSATAAKFETNDKTSWATGRKEPTINTNTVTKNAAAANSHHLRRALSAEFRTKSTSSTLPQPQQETSVAAGVGKYYGVPADAKSLSQKERAASTSSVQPKAAAGLPKSRSGPVLSKAASQSDVREREETVVRLNRKRTSPEAGLKDPRSKRGECVFVSVYACACVLLSL